MTDGESPAELDDEPEARPDWLERIGYFMKPRPAGRIVLVHSGSDSRLRELVLSLLRVAPDLRVLPCAPPILDAPERSAILLVPTEGDAGFLNHVRPVFEQRALRVLLWCDRATVGRLLVHAPDFMHWVSHAVVGARGSPAFAVEGVRCALRARARGIVWRGPMLEEVFGAALPGRSLLRKSAVGGVLEMARAVRDAGPGWLVWTGLDEEEQVRTVLDALALAGRRTRAVLVEPASSPPGFWPLHAETMALEDACRALEAAGARRSGRLAALAGLEPEAIGLLGEILRAGVPEAVIEPELLRAGDPGAEIGWMALERGVVRKEDVARGRRSDPPLLRALARRRALAIWTAPRALAARTAPEALVRAEEAVLRVLRDEPRTAALQPLLATSARGLTAGPSVREGNVGATAHRTVELLLDEAAELHREGRYSEMLRAASSAREGARYLEDIALEVHAARLEADAYRLLGRHGEALSRYSWILGVAADPARRAAASSEPVAYDVLSAFLFWVETALYLPEIDATRLFDVLDAAESFVRAVGRPTWRAGLLLMRARLLGDLGRADEAIASAEEGLVLALRDRTAPGAAPPTFRWSLGHLLRRTDRFEEARALYRAVLDDGGSHPGDRLAALRGLQACSRASGDLVAARRYAERAVEIAEPMGGDASSRSLSGLVEVCVAQGDIAVARAASERLVHLAARSGGGEDLFIAHLRAAEVALAEADVESARAQLVQAQPHAEALDRARGSTTRLDALAEMNARLESKALTVT